MGIFEMSVNVDRWRNMWYNRGNIGQCKDKNLQVG